MGDKPFPCHRSNKDFAVLVYADHTGSQNLSQRIGDQERFAVFTDAGQTVCGSQINSDDCHLLDASVIFMMFVVWRVRLL